jgi:hypothetical protein
VRGRPGSVSLAGRGGKRAVSRTPLSTSRALAHPRYVTFALRIAFASSSGPTLNELQAIRAASELGQRWPASEWVAGLCGIAEIVLPDADVGMAEALRSRGLRAERMVMPRTAAELYALLGFEPMVEGEIRWLFAPSFEPMLVLGARLVDDTWHLDLRRPHGSLLGRQEGSAERPRDLAWRPLQVDVWRQLTPNDAALSSSLASWRAAPSSSSEEGLDGTSISAATMRGGVVTYEDTWSPSRAVDPRGHAMASAGCAFADRFMEPDAASAVARRGWSPSDD